MGETVAKEAHSWKMTEIIPQKTEELKEGFSYSSRPRPLQARRKYRNEPGQAEGYRNLMFDRRIVRGNTYAREDVLPVTAQNIRLIYKERLKRDVLVKLENVSQ